MKKYHAFTMVELLITIVVLGILASVSVLAYSGAQNRARASQRSHDVAEYKKILEYGLVENGQFSDINWLKSKLSTNSSLYTKVIDAGEVGEPCFSETMSKDTYCYYHTDACQYPPGSGCTVSILIYWNYADSTWHSVFSSYNSNYPSEHEPITDESKPDWGTDAYPAGSLKG